MPDGRGGKICVVKDSAKGPVAEDGKGIADGGHELSEPCHSYGATEQDITRNADLAIAAWSAHAKENFTARDAKAAVEAERPAQGRHRAGVVELRVDGRGTATRRLADRARVAEHLGVFIIIHELVVLDVKHCAREIIDRPVEVASQ